MFKVVESRAAGNYAEVVVEVYQSLVGNKGKISGFNISAAHADPANSLGSAIGVKTLIKFFDSINRAFEQYSLNIENMLIKGEKVMVKYSLQGIQTGKLMGKAASGASLKVNVIDVFRLDCGKVVEYWNVNHQFDPAI